MSPQRRHTAEQLTQLQMAFIAHDDLGIRPRALPGRSTNAHQVDELAARQVMRLTWFLTNLELMKSGSSPCRDELPPKREYQTSRSEPMRR